jgi:hypothetical protein
LFVKSVLASAFSPAVFIGGPFSPLSFYVEVRFTSLTDDSPQSVRLTTPPNPLLVSALCLTGIRHQVL